MNARKLPKIAWLTPLLVLLAAIFVKVAGVAGIAGAVSAAAAAFYDFVPGVTQRALQRPSFADEVELVFLIAAGAMILFTLAQARIVHAAIAAAAMIASAALLSLVAAQGSIFLDYLYPSLVFATIFAVGALVRSAVGEGEEMRLARALGPRLPAAAQREIIRRPEMVQANGETRIMTYLVCGVVDFAELADRYANDAAGLAQLVRRFMTILTDAVLANGGTIDQVAPGRVTAFFNAPLEDRDHAKHACDCALRMSENIAALNRERADAGTPPIEIGIGVNTGAGIAANFGAAPHLEYSVAGRSAERADELRELSARYGFSIIAGEATRASAEQRLAFLQIDLASTDSGGPSAPLFAVIGNQHMRSSPKFKALQTFHRSIFEAYGTQDWKRTRELIAQCRTLSGASQRLYDFYLDRIAHYEANPPDEAWHGNFRSASA